MTEEEEDSEAIKTELREAFRLYDKEGAKRTDYIILLYIVQAGIMAYLCVVYVEILQYFGVLKYE